MSKIIELVKLQIKLKRKQIFLWTLIISSIMFMYMILFPYLQDLAQIKLDTLPKEMLQLLGTDSFEDLSNYNNYFSMVYKIIIVAVAVFIATFSSNLICDDEKNSTIEFLYSQPISRTEIYLSKVIVGLIAVITISLSVSLVVVVCGLLVGGDTFNFMNIVKALGASSMVLLLFMSIAITFAGISSKYGVSSVSSFIVLFTYMIGYLGVILEDKAEYLKWFSPFDIYSPSNIHNQMPLRLLIGLVICILLLSIGLNAYKKRDFNI